MKRFAYEDLSYKGAYSGGRYEDGSFKTGPSLGKHIIKPERVEGITINLNNFCFPNIYINMWKLLTSVLDYIKDHPEITGLKLSNNNIGNDLLGTIVKHPAIQHLKSLDLSGNFITYEGAQYLAESLKSLENLILKENDLSFQQGIDLVMFKCASNVIISVDIGGDLIAEALKKGACCVDLKTTNELIANLNLLDKNEKYIDYIIEHPAEEFHFSTVSLAADLPKTINEDLNL